MYDTQQHFGGWRLAALGAGGGGGGDSPAKEAGEMKKPGRGGGGTRGGRKDITTTTTRRTHTRQLAKTRSTYVRSFSACWCFSARKKFIVEMLFRGEGGVREDPFTFFPFDFCIALVKRFSARGTQITQLQITKQGGSGFFSMHLRQTCQLVCRSLLRVRNQQASNFSTHETPMCDS
jgi:hypothetical protein